MFGVDQRCDFVDWYDVVRDFVLVVLCVVVHVVFVFEQVGFFHAWVDELVVVFYECVWFGCGECFLVFGCFGDECDFGDLRGLSGHVLFEVFVLRELVFACGERCLVVVVVVDYQMWVWEVYLCVGGLVVDC